MRRLFVHVGFPKTATTTLQTHLFVKHTQVNYLGKPFSERLAQVQRDILTLDTIQFEKRLETLQGLLRQEADAFADGDLLISEEGFLLNTRYRGHDLGRTARRLRSVLSGALGPKFQLEIIVSLRNQVDLFLSHFVQFVKGSQRDFDSYLEAALEAPAEGFSASLFYDELLSFYAAEYGRERLHVLLFEDFLRDRPGFITELSEILGIDAGESLGLLEDKHEKQKARRGNAYMARGRNRLAKRLNRALGSTVSIRPQQRAAFEALYRASNSRLQAEFGLPLDEHGYPLEAGALQAKLSSAG